MTRVLKDLQGINRIHFVGIGGAGMSPLAKILLQLGYEVSGSDIGTSLLIEELMALGANIWTDGQKAEHVRGADAIVVSTAIAFDNPEVIAAWDLRIPKLHRSDINAALVNSYSGIAVAGSHGKTTTTSMLGVALDYAGISPTIVVGGEVPDLGTNAKLGTGEYLVSEADESDGSFLKLRPSIAVVTNIEDDHMDHYGTMEKIIESFTEFLENIKDNGMAVLCFENINLRSIAKRLTKQYISYGIDAEADYRAKNISTKGAVISFDVIHCGDNLGRIELNIPGRHNVLNALACIAVSLHIGVPFAKIKDALGKFNGAKRRFQTKGKIDGVWIVDDYAHHPTEIAVTLTAARQTEPKRLICIFQPHRYSRTKLLREEFGSAFKEADVLILTDIYAAGEKPIEGVDGETLVKEIEQQTGQQPIYMPHKADIVPYLIQNIRAGDLIITMGAGNILEVGEALVQELENNNHHDIVVLMGGYSNEAEVSRNSAQTIIRALSERGHDVVGLELNPPTFVADVSKLSPQVVFNMVHGKYGEDGIVQGTLSMLGITCTGSDVLAAALTMDKIKTKKILREENIPTPVYRTYKRREMTKAAEDIKERFSLPVVVKAPNQGSSLGVFIAANDNELEQSVKQAFSYGEDILVEEFIAGRELTVGLIGTKGDGEAMPVIEITTRSGRYDYNSKYTTGESSHIVPASINAELTKLVQELAVKAFNACGCEGLARVDLMLDEQEQPYVIEINSVPGMTDCSLVPDAVRAMGMELGELCERVIAIAKK